MAAATTTAAGTRLWAAPAVTTVGAAVVVTATTEVVGRTVVETGVTAMVVVVMMGSVADTARAPRRRRLSMVFGNCMMMVRWEVEKLRSWVLRLLDDTVGERDDGGRMMGMAEGGLRYL